MGESAEKMAKEAGIAREEQDAFAHRSHARAKAAWESGVFAAEVMHVVPPPAFDQPIAADNLVREDSTLEAYAKLLPAFDRKYGTVTAGNSSPLTDGASALLLMTRVEGQGARLRAARLSEVVGLRRARPRRLAAHGPGLRRAEGARARRASR